MYSEEQRDRITERYEAYKIFKEHIDDGCVVKKVNLSKFTGIMIEVGLTALHADGWYDPEDPVFITIEDGMITVYNFEKTNNILLIGSVSKETFDSYPEEFADLQAYIKEHEPDEIEEPEKSEEPVITDKFIEIFRDMKSKEPDKYIKGFYEWLEEYMAP